MPIIFITAHADIPMTVQAMKGGAIEFLTKPFRDQELLDAVEAGLARDRAHRESDRALAALKERFETLSSREREIMILVTAGRLNKQIANDIGIAEIDGEGASQQPDAKDAGPFASRAQPNGGYPQAHARKAATPVTGLFLPAIFVNIGLASSKKGECRHCSGRNRLRRPKS